MSKAHPLEPRRSGGSRGSDRPISGPRSPYGPRCAAIVLSPPNPLLPGREAIVALMNEPSIGKGGAVGRHLPCGIRKLWRSVPSSLADFTSGESQLVQYARSSWMVKSQIPSRSPPYPLNSGSMFEPSGPNPTPLDIHAEVVPIRDLKEEYRRVWGEPARSNNRQGSPGACKPSRSRTTPTADTPACPCGLWTRRRLGSTLARSSAPTVPTMQDVAGSIPIVSTSAGQRGGTGAGDRGCGFVRRRHR